MHAERSVRIVNRAGLHARPCHALVSLALGFESELRVRCGNREVDGKSILGLMTLEATPGTALLLVARGVDAQALVTSLEALIASGFEESP